MENFFTADFVTNIGKAGILGLIVIFFLFVVIVITQVRSLNQIIYIRSSAATVIIQVVLISYLLLIASLFFIALAIL